MSFTDREDVDDSCDILDEDGLDHSPFSLPDGGLPSAISVPPTGTFLSLK